MSTDISFPVQSALAWAINDVATLCLRICADGKWQELSRSLAASTHAEDPLLFVPAILLLGTHPEEFLTPQIRTL